MRVCDICERESPDEETRLTVMFGLDTCICQACDDSEPYTIGRARATLKRYLKKGGNDGTQDNNGSNSE